ncbi:glycosyltransferase family 4 protein [Paracidobacterium acidisoli]|uniref:Glycosyltransferase n=1 Tax=Paracidobacterium acidisoli TaxID=2303751 RepID=A0A372IR47_9BACT|nr:glycosyltransferase family 4 protein [Paracidobacterium acidisoli]MBT9330248.1 glycosyltransferase family 4 protein [Paracidobacterium acidisoli]
MRICIVAEHASFRFGGEASIPLHYFLGLRAAGQEAWLVIHSRTRDEMEAAFPSELSHMRFVSDTWLHKALLQISRPLPRRIAAASFGLLSHMLTQFLERRVVRRLIAEMSIDVVHQPTPVSPRFPSLMTDLGAPVVIGPMNGGMDYPRAFRHAESRLSQISVRYGRRLTNLINACFPGKRHAAVLLVANERTRLSLPAPIDGRVIELPENGVDFATWSSPASASASPLPARFVFIGRLVDWKGVDMAIEALARVPGATLDIIGDGPMRPAWQALAEKLGIAGRVSFCGWLSQKDCSAHLQSATALVLPSIYECGGAVVLEAMAVGIPAIATRWGGPADYLREDCGILVEPSSREALIDGFAAGMQRLISTPDLPAQMGAAGRRRVEEHFNWKRKIEQILEIYNEALPAHHSETGAVSLSR